MLVIHPKDKTTTMLSILYEGLDARVVNDSRSTNEISRLLYHISSQERVMLLGHGSMMDYFFDWMTIRMSLTKLLLVILMLIICVNMEEILWLYGAMPIFSQKRKDYTAYFQG